MVDIGVKQEPLDSRNELPSLVFLLIILGAMGFLQFLLLMNWKMAMFLTPAFVMLEMLILTVIFFISRSLRKKLREMKNVREANLFLSLIGSGCEFDSKNWYEITECPECHGIIDKVQFTPMGTRNIWEFKYCKKCEKYIAKKKIVSESFEESFSGSHNDINDIKGFFQRGVTKK